MYPGFFQDLQRAWLRRGFRRRIRKHGWTAVYIDERPERSELAYTIGFQDLFGQPEVMTFGFDQEGANHILGEAAEALKGGLLVMEDKALWDLGWGVGFSKLAWRAVHPSQLLRKNFNVAIFHGEERGRSRDQLRACQLVVSDGNGVFPWEGGYDQEYLPRQPELWLPYDGPPEED